MTYINGEIRIMCSKSNGYLESNPKFNQLVTFEKKLYYCDNNELSESSKVLMTNGYFMEQ